MNDNKIFSKYYSTDSNKYEDKQKFRNRILKSLEDYVNSNWMLSKAVFNRCRSEIGIDLYEAYGPALYFYIEETFLQLKISMILDFVTIVYESIESLKRNKFREEINRIFEEESMCYFLHENGRVRYYPDEEFQKLTKCTITVLNKPKYSSNLNKFNSVLDSLHANHNKESPIRELFGCIEIFVLSIINDRKYKQLFEKLVNLPA